MSADSKSITIATIPALVTITTALIVSVGIGFIALGSDQHILAADHRDCFDVYLTAYDHAGNYTKKHIAEIEIERDDLTLNIDPGTTSRGYTSIRLSRCK